MSAASAAASEVLTGSCREEWLATGHVETYEGPPYRGLSSIPGFLLYTSFLAGLRDTGLLYAPNLLVEIGPVRRGLLENLGFRHVRILFGVSALSPSP
jgi:hypothetical protein